MSTGFLVNADTANVGLSPPVLEFIKLHLAEFGASKLGVLAERLELAAIIDQDMASPTDAFPQKTEEFRNDCIKLAYVCRVWLGQIDIADHCDPEFADWVKSISGASTGNQDIIRKILYQIGSHGANQDQKAFKLAVGRMLADTTHARVMSYAKETSSAVNPTAVEHAYKIIRSASDSCTFAKIGNQYLFQKFRGRLHVERGTQLVYGETPFREIADQLNDGCNEAVRPSIDVLIKEQFDMIDWATSYDPDHFILAASILREIVDDPIDVVINAEIPYHEAHPHQPMLYVISSNFKVYDQYFGVVQNCKMWSIDEADYAIFATLYEFIRLRADASPAHSSFHQFLQCCELDHDHIPPTNPFKKFL